MKKSDKIMILWMFGVITEMLQSIFLRDKNRMYETCKKLEKDTTMAKWIDEEG